MAEAKKKKLISIDLSVITDRLSSAKSKLKSKAVESKDKAVAKVIDKAEILSQKQLELVKSAKKNHA